MKVFIVVYENIIDGSAESRVFYVSLNKEDAVSKLKKQGFKAFSQSDYVDVEMVESPDSLEFWESGQKGFNSYSIYIQESELNIDKRFFGKEVK